MNKKTLVSTVAAVLLALGSVSATAQSGDVQQRHAQRDSRNSQKARVDKQHRNDVRVRDSRGEHRGQRDSRAERRGPPPHSHAGGRGAGPRHDFYRGNRLPAQYRTRYYVVNDWRGHHLSRPPRGHQWVQTGADYVLIGTASGIIAQIVLAR